MLLSNRIHSPSSRLTASNSELAKGEAAAGEVGWWVFVRVVTTVWELLLAVRRTHRIAAGSGTCVYSVATSACA